VGASCWKYRADSVARCKAESRIEHDKPTMPDQHALPLHVIYKRLFTAYGPQHWWPANSPLEVVVGAILTQNTAWKNVERAVIALKRAGCLSWRRLAALSEDELAELIRPAGTYRVKAGRLKAFVEALLTDHGGQLQRMLGGEVDDARRRLLAVRGIGPETADAILLYAGGRLSFVVDAYTRRILRRHFLMPPRGTTRSASVAYESVRQMFQGAVPPDARVYNEYHALLVELGKRHCRTRAVCAGCPLADLPHDESL
jgi:endonuclease-3 related protein